MKHDAQQQQESESEPRTKLDYNNSMGNFTERLYYNRDPLSYNRGQITIDDDGNMDMRDSPSP